MRLPIVQSDVNVSADYPARGIPAAAFQSGLGMAAAKEIAQGAEDIGRVWERKQKENDAAEAIYLQSQAELALQQSDAARKLTETDGNTYLEGRRKDFQEVLEQVAGQAKNPGAARLLRNHMAGVLVTLDKQALTHASDLIKKSEVAQLTTALDNINSQIGATEYTNTAELARLNGMKEALIGLRSATLGVDEAAKLTIAERKKSTEEVAYRHAQADPEGFLTSLNRYNGMDSEKLDRLVVGAKGRIDAAENKHHERMQEFYRQVEKETEQERQAQLTALDEKAAARTLTSEDLRMARVMRIVQTPAELDHLRALINAPPEHPSDPEVQRIIGADVYGLNPRTREVDIRAAMANHARGSQGLNVKDGLAYITRLRENSQRIEDKAHTYAGQRYNAALEEGRKRLGITSPLETLDPLTKKLDADFTAEMNARADWINPNGEDARKVLYDILPRYVSAQAVGTKLNYETQFKTIDPRFVGAPPDPTAEKTWPLWYEATVKKVEEIKTKEPALYATTKAQLLNLRDAHQRYLDNLKRMQDLPKGGGAAGRTPVEVNP